MAARDLYPRHSTEELREVLLGIVGDPNHRLRFTPAVKNFLDLAIRAPGGFVPYSRIPNLAGLRVMLTRSRAGLDAHGVKIEAVYMKGLRLIDPGAFVLYEPPEASFGRSDLVAALAARRAPTLRETIFKTLSLARGPVRRTAIGRYVAFDRPDGGPDCLDGAISVRISELRQAAELAGAGYRLVTHRGAWELRRCQDGPGET